MRLVVPTETAAGERRVALTPQMIGRFVKAEHAVTIQAGAGSASFWTDQAYEDAGATIVQKAAEVYQEADIVLKVQPPSLDEVDLIPENAALISFLYPVVNHALVEKLAQRRITAFAMDQIPRIARAQSMDALSSMSSLAGYRAALIAAFSLSKYFPMMVTAAGTTAPAKGLVLGAGVAGLQAIATSRRLGAAVSAFDVRPNVKQEVESLGARFIEVEPLAENAEDSGGYATELPEQAQAREREIIHQHVRESDFVITTALIPGKPAPLLITANMVRDMRPGSVVVDLAGESGGNCELTKPGEEIMVGGVTIAAPFNISSSMALHASQFYSRNIATLLEHLVKDGQLNLDFEDSITQGCCVTHQGKALKETS